MSKSQQDVLEAGDEKTQAEKAYRLMREDIVSGALAPDLKLKIDFLRDRYDIGAGPLREALARLSGEHLVTLLGQRGFVVAPMSVADARKSDICGKYSRRMHCRNPFPKATDNGKSG